MLVKYRVTEFLLQTEFFHLYQDEGWQVVLSTSTAGLTGTDGEELRNISSSKFDLPLKVIGVVLIVGGAFYYFRPAEIAIPRISLLAGFFLPMLVLPLLSIPASKKKIQRGLAWYDILLAALGATSCGYIVYDGVNLEGGLSMVTPLGVVLGCAMIMVLSEALRRCMGLAMVVLMLILCIMPLFGDHLPSLLNTSSISLATLINATYLTSTGMFGSLLGILVTVILPFIFLGELFLVGGGGQAIFNVAASLVGRFTGGPAKVAVIASSIVGTMTGGPIPNIAMIGPLTIPIMKKMGYSPEFAGAVESAASTGGTIMPPVMGMVSFIMADYLGIPYGTICVAAAIPAISYYTSLFGQVHFEAKKLGLRGLSREQIPSLWKSIANGWNVVTVFASLVFLLMVIQFTPGRSAYYAIAILLLVSFFTKRTRLGPKRILQAAAGTARSLPAMAVMLAAAGVISACFGVSGLGVQLTHGIVDLAGGSRFLLLLLAAILSFVMGMGLSGVVSYMLLAILVGPTLVKGGILPIAAHLFFFWASTTAHITPPVAPACFLAAPIARARFWPLAWRTVLLGLPMYILPFVFVYNTSLLAIGEWWRIVLAFIGSVGGTLLVAAGVEGFFIRGAGWLQRIVLIVAGGAILVTMALF
ncbi:MAG: TRAP transporter fused permease subunit [Chloroflexota bacterium]